MICCLAVAVCALCTAAADGLTSISPSPQVLRGDGANPSPPTIHHSTMDAVTGTQKVHKDASPQSVSVTSVSSTSAMSWRAATTIFVTSGVTAKSPTPPPENVVSSSRATTPSSSPVASLTIPSSTRPAAPRPGPTPSSTPSSTPRRELLPPPSPPPASTPTLAAGSPTYSRPRLERPRASTARPFWPRDQTEREEAVEKISEVEAAGEPPCDFDPCVHLQQTCPELKEVKGWNCMCPVLTSDPSSVTPGPVVALEVIRVRPGSAGVRWCAPYSAPSAFLVWVLRQDGSSVSNISVSSWVRQTDVFGLEAGHAYHVCVSAQSGASVSHKRCAAVHTPPDGGAIALYVLSGGCGVLLLTAAVLAAFLNRQCKRRPAAGTPALFNPATTPALHDPRLASLVSISNPAYAPDDEQRAAFPANANFAHRAQPKKTTNAQVYKK